MQFRLCPRSELIVKVAGCISKCCKNDNLAVTGIDGVPAFPGNNVTQGCQFGISTRINLGCRCVKSCQPVTIFNELLLPTDQIHIMKQDLDLAANEQAFEGGIVKVNIGNVDLIKLSCFLFNT